MAVWERGKDGLNGTVLAMACMSKHTTTKIEKESYKSLVLMMNSKILARQKKLQISVEGLLR